MAEHRTNTETDVNWDRFKRDAPQWYTDAKFGIFIHWGAYSLPAFGEPIGELGTMEAKKWFPHNPYAEWYFNTIRIEGSPAQKYHQETFGGAPYDNFLDQWKAEKFDPDKWAELFAYSGAQYVLPTTKHHDGIALWQAPGTGTRNTVDRGPKRDLIGDIATAVRKNGLHFGVYYSGGLDWSITNLPPHNDEYELERPSDAAYSMYCYEHVVDIIDRYKPEVIFNDINWPDFSKREGEYSLPALFDYYYAKVPTGLVNDRWGVPHHDYKTSEYKMNLHVEDGGVWENNRGIGYSFGYNQLENDEHYLDLPKLLHHFLDIISRGGNLLLNVGPTASGEIPELQQRVLREMGDWMKINSEAVYKSHSAPEFAASESPFLRWTGVDNRAFAFIEAQGRVSIEVSESLVDDSSATFLGGGKAEISRKGSEITVDIPTNLSPIAVLAFNRR
jgi:alpha-L-fucosidase